MNVNVLATCLKPETLPMCLLVFRTIRTGFPTANIIVYGNGLGAPGSDPVSAAFAKAANAVGAEYRLLERMPHGAWIEQVLEVANEPFWICDTDIVFWDKVEDWFAHTDALFCGRYEPEYWEKWTKTIHVSRLHPSLMWFHPQLLRPAMRCWPPGAPQFLNTAQHNLIQWNWVPEFAKPVKLYDVCSGLHQALGGVPFTDAQNDCFEHLLCGTYAHLIPGSDELLKAHALAVHDHTQLRGLWRKQMGWFLSRSIIVPFNHHAPPFTAPSLAE